MKEQEFDPKKELTLGDLWVCPAFDDDGSVEINIENCGETNYCYISQDELKLLIAYLQKQVTPIG